MRSSILLSCLVACLDLHAGICTIDLRAPEYAGEHVVLYLYSDLVTDRLEMVAQAVIAPDGSAHLEADVTSTRKARLRVNIRQTGLFLGPGAHYTIRLPHIEAGPTTINGTMELVPEFEGLDILDVNALVSDLNTRLDDFLAEGLATDEDAGMNAVQHLRTLPKDSLKKNTALPSLSVMPAPSQQRVDTFELKLRKFYAEVKDRWFWHYFDYSIAGLRFSPRTDDRELFERYIKGKPIHYDDPEQLRFLQNFFGEHLMTEVFRRYDERLKAHVNAASVDSVMAVFALHPFLRDDDALRELVMINELYSQYHGSTFSRPGIERILAQVHDGSTVAQHRTIAGNMLWDLTTMRTGSTFPSLALGDVNGGSVLLDGQLKGAVCIAVTAAWCAYCEMEMEALEKLHTDYGKYVTFIVIDVDSSRQAFTRYAAADKARDWTWLWAGDDPLFMDELRLHAVPAFFLLNDRTIAQSPAPVPSDGMAEIFYKIKVEAEEKNRIHFGNEPPPPKRDK